MHHPVLLKEALEGLNIKQGGFYIDATAGEGGHLIEIANRGGKVLGIDLDEDQIINLKHVILERTKRAIESNKKDPVSRSKTHHSLQDDIILVQGNFAEIEKIARENNFVPADGILFDLGLSMRQLENSGRGFSYKKIVEPLDMRMNTNSITTVIRLVNEISEDELYELLARYGEDPNSHVIAQTIVKSRSKKPVHSVKDLTDIIDITLGRKDIKTYARIFQALRIAANSELDNLREGLTGGLKVLNKHGRIVVIAFHSVEDRVVKQFIHKHNLKQINKKVKAGRSTASFERSAKLRIIEI